MVARIYHSCILQTRNYDAHIALVWTSEAASKRTLLRTQTEGKSGNAIWDRQAKEQAQERYMRPIFNFLACFT